MPRVLYIDEDISVLLKSALEKHGYKVDAVSSGNEGIKLHSAEPYDFVDVSSRLTDMTGIDSCEKLLLNDPDLASLFLAGKGDEKLISRALSIGVSQYLVKDDDSDYLQLLPGIISNLQRRKVDTPKN